MQIAFKYNWAERGGSPAAGTFRAAKQMPNVAMVNLAPLHPAAIHVLCNNQIKSLPERLNKRHTNYKNLFEEYRAEIWFTATRTNDVDLLATKIKQPHLSRFNTVNKEDNPTTRTAYTSRYYVGLYTQIDPLNFPSESMANTLRDINSMWNNVGSWRERQIAVVSTYVLICSYLAVWRRLESRFISLIPSASVSPCEIKGPNFLLSYFFPSPNKVFQINIFNGERFYYDLLCFSVFISYGNDLFNGDFSVFHLHKETKILGRRQPFILFYSTVWLQIVGAIAFYSWNAFWRGK